MRDRERKRVGKDSVYELNELDRNINLFITLLLIPYC